MDEAHKWYFASTIRGIIRDLKPKHQFLLTGTPFKFNLNRGNFIIDYTSVSSLYKMGYIGDVNMQVLHTSLPLSRLDWVSMTDNIRPDKRIGKEDLDSVFTEVIQELIKKLKLPMKNLSSAHNISRNALSVFGKLQKTIIFTHGIPEANCLSEYLKACGVNCIVSHSKVDGEIAEESFKEFAEDKDIKVLVSVNRGKEGFDFSELYNIIDMTYSQNFEVVMQMIGRLLRPSKEETFKVFYKVAPKNTAGYFTDWMDCLIQLFDDYWYSKFNGRNTLDMRVPNALLNRPKTPRTPVYIQDGKNKIEVSVGTSFTKGTKITVLDKDFKKVPLKDGNYKIPQEPTNDNPKPEPIEIEVKAGVITKTTAPNTRGRITPKNLQSMGFDNSLSFMEKNDWFRLEDPLSTVATTTLRKVIHNFENGSIGNRNKKELLFLPFNEAKKYIIGIDDKWKSSKMWPQYCISGEKPNFITSCPYKVYDEWVDWSDWFSNKWLDVEDAKIFVHSLNLKSNNEWNEYCKSGNKPDNIPANYRTVYGITTGEWLGTNRISDWERVFVTLDELKALVKEEWRINSKTQWYDYWKINQRPTNVPADPSSIYKRLGVWISWSHLFGN